ncbi:MAG TPA: hypothetical protein DCO77_10085 [Nitrospiraceae bacterium]|nr:hypothetical protein [Nitrospiraceae bacterium]
MNSVLLFGMNLYLYSLFFLVSAVVIPALTLFVTVASFFLTHRKTMKRFRRAINWYGRVMMLFAYPFIKVHYEDLGGSDASKPSVIVANHRSASDAFLLCFLREEFVQVVNVWPFRLPVLGIYAKLSGYLNVKKMSPESFLSKALQLLRDGISIAFFPEGTRSASRKMGNFHGTAFRLAMEARVPVAPLCISGNENIPPKGSLLLRPGTIRIRRLAAIPWEEYRDLTAFAFKNRVREIIGNELSRSEE